LRFPAFEGEWKRTTIANECIINPKTECLNSEFVYVDLGSVVKGRVVHISHVTKSEAPSRAQRVLSDKDILFQCVRPYQLNNYIYHKQDRKQWVASTGYAQIRTKHDVDFLYHLLNSPQFNQEVILRCTGTSYPAISSTDIGNIPISICSNDEQEKIGVFLLLLDQRIETQIKIIEGLESLIWNIALFFSILIHLDYSFS
jgi:type I restriction enzyme S subunit